MSQGDNFGRLGADPVTERVISEVFPDYPESRLNQMFSDPQTALLAARVRQETDTPALDTVESQDTEARYYAETYTVTANGPRKDGAEPENVEGAKIDLGTEYDTFDLRFDDHITVAFKSAIKEHREIHYRPEDSPVAGKRAQTRYVWLRRHEQASTDPTVHIEGDQK